MERKRQNYWRCDFCDEIIPEGSLLTAPSPFDEEEIINGCPECRAAEGFTAICMVYGCSQPATCGTPVKDEEYLRCCGQHYFVVNPQRHKEIDR